MLPRCHDTDQSFCPKCGEPCDELDTEAFELLDIEVCRSCGTEAFEARVAAHDEAEDRRRDNPLEPDFRRLGV